MVASGINATARTVHTDSGDPAFSARNRPNAQIISGKIPGSKNNVIIAPRNWPIIAAHFQSANPRRGKRPKQCKRHRDGRVGNEIPNSRLPGHEAHPATRLGAFPVANQDDGSAPTTFAGGFKKAVSDMATSAAEGPPSPQMPYQTQQGRQFRGLLASLLLRAKITTPTPGSTTPINISRARAFPPAAPPTTHRPAFALNMFGRWGRTARRFPCEGA